MPTRSSSLTTRQLAESIGVSESSVKRWVDDGTIAAIRTAGGHRRISMAAAVGFIRRHRTIPQKPHLLALPSPPAFGDIDADAADSLYQALLGDDAGQARSIITGRYLAGAQIAAIGDGLIRPVLARIGELWRDDADGILVEHRAVESCIQALSEITTWLPQLTEKAPAAVTAAGPGDPYLLPSMLASLTLRERGVRARNLGPQTPLETLSRAVDRYGASVCSVSLSVAPDAKRTSDWLALADTMARVGGRLVVGGRCVESLPKAVRDRVEVCGSMAELSAYAAGLQQAAPPATKGPQKGRKGKPS